MMVEGEKELNAQFNRLKELKFSEVPVELAEIILKAAQSIVPVKTGFLRDSGEVEETNDGATVGFTANYAVHVEYGTSKQRAQPFLRPAVDRVMRTLGNTAKDLVEGEIEKAI